MENELRNLLFIDIETVSSSTKEEKNRNDTNNNNSTKALVLKPVSRDCVDSEQTTNRQRATGLSIDDEDDG